MTLLQLTEPVFQYMCRLNRLARRGGSPKAASSDTSFVALSREAAQSAAPLVPARGANLDYTVARSEIKAVFEDMAAKAAAEVRLSQQYRKIELPLIFFVDSMISESKLSFASEWNQNRLAFERQELTGDDKFFDLLEETQNEPSDDASERLAVFYICIGLGFTGCYFNQPELLRKTMLSIAPRIRHLVENDQNAKICPEAYEAVDTRDLVQPPGSRMVFVGLIFAGFVLAVLAAYIIMYRQASSNLSDSMDDVLKRDVASSQSK
jgi:type IV/VI secretion system ImpK/VasF family protein